MIFAAAVLYTSVGHAGASGYIAAMALMGLAPDVMKPTALTLNILVASFASLRWTRNGKDLAWKSLLPLVIASVPAAFIGAFFTGSLLIETLFSLDGLGLLSYESVIRRDYPVVMGTLYLFTLIGLVTKLISDLCYVWVDPRVKFD